MKNYFFEVKYLVILLVCVAAFVGAFVSKNQKNSVQAAPKTGTLDSSIPLAMAYIGNATLPSGRFVYTKNLDSSIKYNSKRYNALRHAGTLYSMYLCELYLKDFSLQQKRYLASDYFVKNYIEQISTDMYAVVSKPEEESLEYPQAKLGGSGLALIGLSNLYPDKKIDLKIIQGLGNFIIYMQKSDGSFYSKYNMPQKEKDEKFVSLYYPGEVCLGLLYLYSVDPQKKWLDTSKKGLIYLANSRKDKGVKVPYDHWAMLATKKLFDTPKNGLTPAEKLLLQKHAEQMANSILYKQIVDKDNKFVGAFEGNVKLCSIGTIMEGLVAIYGVTDDEKLKYSVMKALYLGTEFLSRYQVKDGILRGGIPTTAYWKSPKADSATKAVRIDNVQHVLSAWITYKQLFAD